MNDILCVLHLLTGIDGNAFETQRFSIECRNYFAFALVMFHYTRYLQKLAPLSHLIRSKTETNYSLGESVISRLTQGTSFSTPEHFSFA